MNFGKVNANDTNIQTLVDILYYGDYNYLSGKKGKYVFTNDKGNIYKINVSTTKLNRYEGSMTDHEFDICREIHDKYKRILSKTKDSYDKNNLKNNRMHELSIRVTGKSKKGIRIPTSMNYDIDSMLLAPKVVDLDDLQNNRICYEPTEIQVYSSTNKKVQYWVEKGFIVIKESHRLYLLVDKVGNVGFIYKTIAGTWKECKYLKLRKIYYELSESI